MTGPKRMTKKFLILILTFFIFSGCSFLSKKIESLAKSSSQHVEDAEGKANANKKNLFCFQKNKTHLLLEDESTIKFYQPLIPTIFESKNFSFPQKAAMLSLIEMNRRPDVAAPTARIQYYLRFNNKNYYYDVKPSADTPDLKMPLIKGIEVLLKTFDSSKTLLQVANSLETLLPINMSISFELEKFLNDNRSEFLKNDLFTDTFFKGDEILTKHEYFKRSSLSKILANYYSNKLSTDSLYDLSKDSMIKLQTPDSSLELKCNVDINNDNILNEKIVFSQKNRYHYFAIREGDNVFIAVSSSIAQKPFTNIENTHFIKSQAGLTPLPICQLSNNLQDMALFSMGERNPAQHLKHLISYEVERTNSFQSLEELLVFSRHLFLSDPDRILYESKKGRKSQLDFFLTMNFPIYHVEVLGDIFGVAAFKNKKQEERSLIVDERSQARIWCGP